MGKYLIETHRCVLPEIEPYHNLGTVWQCDCSKKFQILHTGWQAETGGIRAWADVRPIDWNEKEQRLCTPQEKAERWAKHLASQPEKHLTFIDRIKKVFGR